MAHMLSYIAGRFARETVKEIVSTFGGSISDAHMAGLAAQVTVGTVVGIVTLDAGGKVATLGDVALGSSDLSDVAVGSSHHSFHSSPYAGGPFYTESTSAPDYVPPEDRHPFPS